VVASPAGQHDPRLLSWAIMAIGGPDRELNLKGISFVDRIQTTSIAQDLYPIFRSRERLSPIACRLSSRSVVGIKLSWCQDPSVTYS
jgi:hypothetical protein